MPRYPRIDSPGLLHHVIVLEIVRSTIFHDDDDRYNFLDRLQSLLFETETECLAWALIPNHFHLLSCSRRTELVGGGLRRSQTEQNGPEEEQDYDERVLGSGGFVTGLREQGLLDRGIRPRINLEELRSVVANYCEVPEESMKRRSRGGQVSQARALFCYCAMRKFNYSGTLVGRSLGMGSSSVSRAAQRGEDLVQADTEVGAWLEKLLKQ